MRTASRSFVSVRSLVRVFLAVVIVGLGLAAAGHFLSIDTAAADPIYACYHQSNYSLRSVPGPGNCAGNETQTLLNDNDHPIWICLHSQPGHIRYAGDGASPSTINCWGAGSTQFFQLPGDAATTLCVNNVNSDMHYPPYGPNDTVLVIPPRNRPPVVPGPSARPATDVSAGRRSLYSVQPRPH